jgi:hypothetical protein
MPISIGLNVLKTIKFSGTFKAIADNVVTYFGISKDIYVIANDEFPAAKESSITISKYPIITLNGNLILSSNKKYLTYTPNINFFGIDTFTYNLTDGRFKSNTTTCSVSVFCKPPVIIDKTFKLIPDKIYTLDIFDPNCHPGEIIFKNNEIDRDLNVPSQTVSIVPSSVVATGNITILEVGNNTIKFRTAAITDNTASTALTYKIKNNLCELDNTQKFDLVTGGSATNPTNNNPNTGSGGTTTNIGIITKLNLNSYIKPLRSATNMSVPQTYTQFVYADNTTNSDLSEIGAWYSLCFSNYGAADKFYIIMRGKPTLNNNGTFTTRNDLYRGQIGEVQYKGRFVFYKPQFYTIELWVDTDRPGSVFTFGITDLFNPVNMSQYIDPSQRPSADQINKCLNYISGNSSSVREKEIYTTSTDYTNTYTGTSKPSFA